MKPIKLSSIDALGATVFLATALIAMAQGYYGWACTALGACLYAMAAYFRVRR